MHKLLRQSLSSFHQNSLYSLRFLSTIHTPKQKFRSILIANRGEIAVRIIKTAQKLGIETVAVYSDADVNAQHVKLATKAYHIGPASAIESYLNYKKILQVCKLSGAEAIHPGYGFLSENAEFARSCAEEGIEFIGPPASAIEAMGSKSASKNIMIQAGVPVTPGYHGTDQSIETLMKEAKKIGYPVLIKAVQGGGGKGMRIVEKEIDFEEMLSSCVREAKSSFGDDRVLVEKYLRNPRHVEFQIFGDKFGNVVHMFERDCSIQRRHQKVLEEAPAPHISDALRMKMGAAAVSAAKAVNYCGAGTVEFLLDADESFYFMEMNTRLQVEHPVTEMIAKLDLVELQLDVASGHKLPFLQEDLKIHGHAIEARIYAENPYNNFLPCSGKLTYLRLPAISPSIRVDTGVVEGDDVSVYYDPMIAKLISHGSNRKEALDGLAKALHQYQILGLPTNIEFVIRTVEHPQFRDGQFDTNFLEVYRDDVQKPLESSTRDIKILAAACFLLMEQNRAQAFTPWTLPNLQYFRSLGEHHRKFKIRQNEEIIEVSGKHVEDGGFAISLGLTDGDAPVEVVKVAGSIQNDGNFNIYIGAQKFCGTAVILNDSLHLFCNDGTQTYKHTYTAVLPALKKDLEAQASSAAKQIKAPMPGKIIKLLVAADQTIKQGQALLIMEAMKMEHVIRSPTNGKVSSIFCQGNDFVDDAKTLLELA